MRIISYFHITLLISIFSYKNAFVQEFKILKNDNSSLLLEFTFDTIKLKKIIENEKNIDFSKFYYCSNLYKKPILPIFNFTIQLKDSSLASYIQSIKEKRIEIKSIRKGAISKKRGINSNNSKDISFDFINISQPYVFRDFIGQNIQISPLQHDSITNTLVCKYKIVFKVFFEKKLDIGLNTNDFPRSFKTNENNFYSFVKENKRLKSLNPSTSELLIIYKNTNTENAILLANWKNQKGIKTTLYKLENESTADEIKSKLITYYENNPNLKYILLLGNHIEIPAYNYGLIDGDNYYSDSYYGQITNDYYPELFVGRITGSTDEIKSIIKKSIFYEKENFNGDWMNKSMGIGSNEGLGEGDNGEADWQHLRNIKEKLKEFGYTKVYEFYDGDHGGEDLVGSPNKTDIINALNEGVSLVNYTGHGDDNLMLTSQLSSSDIYNLTNQNKNPFIVSVACDNGKFISNQGTIAEAFLKCKDENTLTGSIAFCGSSILMDWAPPMLTQDEIINTITSSDTNNIGYSIGELFYLSQIKMLNKYNSLGNGVMQTWILFGDPSIELKTKKPQILNFSYDFFKNTNELIVKTETDNILLGISENNNYINSYLLKKGLNKIKIDTITNSILLTFTKPNYITTQDTLTITNSIASENFKHVNLYPNPINFLNSKLTITGLSSYKNVSLVDVLGKEQKIDIINEINKIILVSENEIKSGIYFLKIIDNQNNNITKRIIVN